MLWEHNTNYISYGCKQYVLSEWNIEKNQAIGYILRAAKEMMYRKSTLIIGLGGGCIVGELSRYDRDKHFVCVELDETTKAYERFKPYFPTANDVTVLYQDFQHIQLDESFDCIFGDIPFFYEHVHSEQRLQLITKLMSMSSVQGCLWILNTLTIENTELWKDYICSHIGLQASRPKIIKDGNHCMLKTLIH
jgi:hypothetical protein